MNKDHFPYSFIFSFWNSFSDFAEMVTVLRKGLFERFFQNKSQNVYNLSLLER